MKYSSAARCLVASATSLLLACSAPARPALPASGWTIEQNAQTWTSTGFEENEDLSGIASLDGKNILVGSDELIAAQSGVLDKTAFSLKAGDLVQLMQNPSGKKMEIDIEGVAAAPEENCYYVTGSHGTGKKKGDYEASRASVFKIPTDPATGAILPAGIQRASLIPWAEQNETFREYTKKPLQLNGFNVEGLAWRAGKLYFGVRGPNIQGSTYVIETTTASLFSGSSSLPACTVHTLPVGEARGIRELLSIRDGFIILTGNASAEATKKSPTTQARMADKVFDLFLWQPDKTPALSTIGVVPRPGAKAEALLLLEDTPTHADLLILFDGTPNGAPQSYRISRN